MTMVLIELLGTLALAGIIRAIMLYLFQKYDNRVHWVGANFAAALLRTVFAVPRLWHDPNIFLDIAVLFGIYVLEQLVWFLYDGIQSRRNNTPAGWGLIFGIIIGGVFWLFVLRLLTFYVSSRLLAI